MAYEQNRGTLTPDEQLAHEIEQKRKGNMIASDTPRTDVCQGSDGTIRECYELAELASTLERELSAALAENAKLTVERDGLKPDAERYRWGVTNARWIRHEHEAYVAIPVDLKADLSCVATRTAAIDAAIERGKGATP